MPVIFSKIIKNPLLSIKNYIGNFLNIVIDSECLCYVECDLWYPQRVMKRYSRSSDGYKLINEMMVGSMALFWLYVYHLELEKFFQNCNFKSFTFTPKNVHGDVALPIKITGLFMLREGMTMIYPLAPVFFAMTFVSNVCQKLNS